MIRLLGRGGEGDVYLVKHLVTEQLRAAKILGAGIHGNRLHELYMMKHLKHPSLPQIIDVLEEDEKIWLIMEYIRGGRLSVINRKKESAEQFFNTAEQLAEVLNYLHTRTSPIIHLDIKPSNILIRPDGRLVLIDFGTSIECQSGADREHHFGTKGYAAPEQLNAGDKADVRSDIYSYGAVMYYYLYGIPPDEEQIAEKGHIIFSWERSAQKIIFRCLKTAKEERFQNSTQLLRMIRRQKRICHMKAYVLKVMCAFIFLTVVFVFLVQQMTEEYKNERNTEAEQYEILLKRSEGLGFEQACGCYEEAAGIYPSDYRWVNQFIDRVSEDYLFEEAEEIWWNRLLFGTLAFDDKTANELLSEDKEKYGFMAYRIGIIYWYYYEAAGGKYAAYRWFCESLECASALENTPKWYESAQIHAKIGAYYEKMGRAEAGGNTETEEEEVTAGIYWSDLKLLWNLEYTEAASEQIRYQVAEELLSFLMLRGYELAQEGIKKGEMCEMINLIRDFLEQSIKEEAGSADGVALCDEAEKAVERIFNTK